MEELWWPCPVRQWGGSVEFAEDHVRWLVLVQYWRCCVFGFSWLHSTVPFAGLLRLLGYNYSYCLCWKKISHLFGNFLSSWYFVQLDTRVTEPYWFLLVNVVMCRPRSHMAEWIYSCACSYPVHCLEVNCHFYVSVPLALGTAPPFALLVGWVGIPDPDWTFWWGNKSPFPVGNWIISDL